MEWLGHQRARRTAAPAAFAPTDIAGCVLWLRADGITGLSDGDPVTTWADESGEGNDATQATTAKKPSYETGVLNGKPVVRFDGVDDELSGISVAKSGAYSLFVVAKKVGAITGGLLDFNRSDNFGSYFESAGKFALNHRNTEAIYTPNVPETWWLLSGKWDGAEIQARVNGSNGSAVTMASVLTDDPMTGRLGRLHDGYYLNGDIAEVLLYNSALNGANVSSVEGYLEDKYALY